MEGLALAVRERLRPFVAGAIRDHHAAEDVLQDVVVILIEQAHLLRRSDRFWPWIFRIAWSRVQDHFRDQRRCRRAVPAGSGPADHTIIAGDPLDTIVHQETVEQLSLALDRLNRRSRTVLYLRFYEQMPYTEIASLLHSTPGQVRLQFHRAKRLLRTRLLASCA